MKQFQTQVGDLLFINKDRKIQKFQLQPGSTFKIKEDLSGICNCFSTEVVVLMAGTLRFGFEPADVVKNF